MRPYKKKFCTPDSTVLTRSNCYIYDDAFDKLIINNSSNHLIRSFNSNRRLVTVIRNSVLRVFEASQLQKKSPMNIAHSLIPGLNTIGFYKSQPCLNTAIMHDGIGIQTTFSLALKRLGVPNNTRGACQVAQDYHLDINHYVEVTMSLDVLLIPDPSASY